MTAIPISAASGRRGRGIGHRRAVYRGPVQEACFARLGQPVDAAALSLEPAVDVPEQDAGRVRRNLPQLARTPRSLAHHLGAGQGALAVGRHDGLPGCAAHRGVPAPALVLAEQEGSALRVRPWPVWARLGQDLDRAPRRVDREEAEAEQAAQPVRAAVAVTSTAGSPHRKPDLVGSGEAVDPLQDQLQRQAELELGDDQEGRFTGPDGDDVAAADLALRLVAEPPEMCLHRSVERGLGRAARLGLRHSVFPISGPTAERANPALG